MMTMYLSPYRRMTSLREAMERAYEENLREKTLSEREMLLAVDVIANPDEFLVSAFVPGLEADDLSIEILNNTLSIRGEFKTALEEGAKYMTCELPSGRFARVVNFPVDVDAAKVEASIKNGFLTLHVPKSEVLRPQPIKINWN
jgi:HSP20 family protein